MRAWPLRAAPRYGRKPILLLSDQVQEQPGLLVAATDSTAELKSNNAFYSIEVPRDTSSSNLFTDWILESRTLTP
jgi:hypothetical protein